MRVSVPIIHQPIWRDTTEVELVFMKDEQLEGEKNAEH